MTTTPAATRELTQVQRVTAGRVAMAFWLSNPAEQVTVSASGITVVCATDVQAARWREHDFGVPVAAYVWRSLGVAS